MAESKVYTVSDVFNCAVCGTEVIINRSLIALKEGIKIVQSRCPICGHIITKVEEKPA
jgi:transcription elongation factor Elf1